MALLMGISFLPLGQWCLRPTPCWQTLMLPLDEVLLPFSSPGSSLLALCHLSPAASANICIVIQFRGMMDVEIDLPNEKKSWHLTWISALFCFTVHVKAVWGQGWSALGWEGGWACFFGRQCWLLPALKLECRGSLNPSNCNCPLELVFNSNFPLHGLFCPAMGRYGKHAVLGLNSPPSALSEVHFYFNIIIIRKENAWSSPEF